MSVPAIQIERLSKAYQISQSGQLAPYRMLREDLAALARRALRPLRARRREQVWALRDLSVRIETGEVVGLIGHNGAGKSTLLKVLSRITEPTSGFADLYGRVGALLEVGTGFHPELTGRENVYLSGAVLGMSKQEIDRSFESIVTFAGVERFIDTPLKHYSSGMQVRLGFSVAAHLEAEILLVDEVLAVGDFAFQRKCLGRVRELSSQGRTVILVSHQMEAVANLCTRAILLQEGRVVTDGKPAPIIEEYLRSATKLAEMSLRDRRDRQGSGPLRWIKTWVEDRHGRPSTTVLSGEDTVLVAEYEVAPGETVTDLAVAFALYTGSGTQITDLTNLSTAQTFDGRIPERGQVRCRIHRTPLAPGTHTYNINATSGSHIHDFIMNAGVFEVEAGDFFATGKTIGRNQGLVLLAQDWELR